jgi:aryl-alcohol dehydrogenase-like predicted oxidoreductase
MGSTQFSWGPAREGHTVNRRNTVNRKYLMQDVDGTLQRFGLDHIDLAYGHRAAWLIADKLTPEVMGRIEALTEPLAQ